MIENYYFSDNIYLKDEKLCEKNAIIDKLNQLLYNNSQEVIV